MSSAVSFVSFVESGGSIVATYETSLYDEWGVRRDDFGLASLLGVSFSGRVEGPMMNSYLTIEKDPQTGRYHPLLSGFEDATRIINGANMVHVAAKERFPYAPLTVVPSYPDLPMEEVFPRPAKVKKPEFTFAKLGADASCIFPMDVDRMFWEVLDVDHGKLLRNAMLWATNEPPPSR